MNDSINRTIYIQCDILLNYYNLNKKENMINN